LYAFDPPTPNGHDLRGLPLIERALTAIMPKAEGRVLFLDSIAARRHDLLRVAWELDLGGIVAK
jgi:ATP-dependent DNA ligase